MDKHIVLLPGDGIGKEIIDSAVKVLEKVGELYNHHFTFEERYLGGSAYDKFGSPLPQETIDACKNADAVLLGAVGGPKYDDLPRDKRPERGLLGIRKALGLFANLRPVKGYDPLLHASPIRKDVIQGSDILIVRELTSGLYFGEPSERRENGEAVVDTLYYHRSEIERIVDRAFRSARLRNKHLTSVDKANVLESSRMWREVVEEKSKDYPDVKLDHLLVDAAAMKLITNPSGFDVIVTKNLFGDILSDEASVLTGSLGMLPSASMNESGFGLYEPVHGSAPDIAGKRIANPLAMIRSAALMLQNSFELSDEAKTIEDAITDVLNEGYYTADLDIKDGKQVGTSDMLEQVLKHINK